MRHRNNLVCSDQPRLHNIHMLPPNGIIQLEQLPIMFRNLEIIQLIHGTPPLVGNVVNDKHTASIGHLVIIAVVRLEVEGQQGCVPVVGDKDQVVIAIGDAATGDMPGGFECCLLWWGVWWLVWDGWWECGD